MTIKIRGMSVCALLCAMSSGGVAMAQGTASAPGAAPTAAPPPAAPAAPAAPPAAVPPAAAPPVQQGTVPPGYMLVPVQSPQSQTQYQVQYPQQKDALPPGMELPYEDGDPIPPGYRIAKQPRRGLVTGGFIMTGIGWSLSVTGAVAANFEDNSGFLLVPVLGPWLMLASGGASDVSCSGGSGYNYDCGTNSGLRSILVLDGLLQTAGAIMAVSGFAFPKTRLVREDITIGFVPTTFGPSSAGVGAVGTF